jgi:hypothetical protein
MIELAARVPINLSSGQVRLLAVLFAALILSLLAGGLIESALTRAVEVLLRLRGHRPPPKSAFTMALDEMDERLRERHAPDRGSPRSDDGPRAG